MYRILIVEDDPTIARITADALSGWGYDVVCAEDFTDITGCLKKTMPHIVLMDIGLPHYNGFHWCKEIRRISNVPVVFVSSASDNMNIVMAIHNGADDFISKPFDLTVLTAKIQALLRRSYDFSATQNSRLEYRGAVLEVDIAALIYEGKKIDLTRNEFCILKVLLENKGKVVSREEIMRRLWDDENFIDDNTLTVNVARLRHKLADAGLEDFVLTKISMGYWIPEE